MGEWKILSKNIDYFIKGLWGCSLFKRNEEIFNIFLNKCLKDNMFIDLKNKKQYYISNKEIDRMRVAFYKRVEKKKENIMRKNKIYDGIFKG